MTSISNRDWLMQLAHEAPDELAAWMGAEHVDGGFAKSAKRAAAAERLKDARYHTLADYVRAMLGWGHEPHFEDCRDALIDLLTDGSCGQDADQGIRAEAPVRESCTNLDAQLDRKPTDAVREFAERYEQRIAELERELDTAYGALEIAVKNESRLERERDGWRMRCGELLDAAHAMQGVADAWDEEV